jgi:hypothetical protein
VNDSQNQHIPCVIAVDDDVISDSEASLTNAQIRVSVAAHFGVSGKVEKSASDRVNKFVCSLEASAFDRYVTPNLVQIGFNFGRSSIRH